MALQKESIRWMAVVLPVLLAGCSLLGLGQKPICEDPKAMEYVSQVVAIAQANERAFDELGDLMEALGANATLINSPSWREAIRDEVSKIEQYSRSVEQTKVPRREFAQFHQMLRNAFGDYSAGAKALETALFAVDFPGMDEAFVVLSNGDAKLNDAFTALEALVGSCP